MTDSNLLQTLKEGRLIMLCSFIMIRMLLYTWKYIGFKYIQSFSSFYRKKITLKNDLRKILKFNITILT